LIKTFWVASLFLLAACAKDRSATSPNSPPDLNPANQDTTGLCTEPCDASPPSIPTLGPDFSYGDITTYGSVTQPMPSAGGACNYGPTEVYAFAAIQVHQLPGDLRGQWQGGTVCGQCVEVSLRSPEGWKTTVVRIMDKCPDAHCGVDLGGAPAKLLMGEKPGRYSGKWTWVSCEGHAETSDGPPNLFVKEGSNAYWSLVHVRNAAERIAQIRMRLDGADSPWTELPWATEAENFFKVPATILQDPRTYEMQIILPSGPRYATRLKGSDLAAEKTMHTLSSI
jgi:expansin (peptidoglycan-binding protein)